MTFTFVGSGGRENLLSVLTSTRKCLFLPKEVSFYQSPFPFPQLMWKARFMQWMKQRGLSTVRGQIDHGEMLVLYWVQGI